MAADFLYDSEMLPLVIAHPKVRRSRCMCLLFLFLIATFVGLVPIMVYRSLGVPLPEGLKGYRNVHPWMVVSQPQLVNESPTPLGGADVQVPLSAQQQINSETNAKSKSISIPKAHLHPPRPTQGSTSILLSDLPSSTDPIP